ncbi:MAG: DoxX family protein [Sphingorhabdus sp.]
MIACIEQYNGLVAKLGNTWIDDATLLLVRLSLAGIFWRSGRTKVEEGSWLSLSDTTTYLFREEYSAIPIPLELAAYLATYSEHLFPVLIAIGLFTRLSALALLGLTMVIQIFVYPDAWWTVHITWVALATVLITHGGGKLTIDQILVNRT